MIRLATQNDLEQILEIYAYARKNGPRNSM